MAGAGPEIQFDEILQKLNPAQKQAVDRIEGPVLVVAGPGTGKTHILAARVGKILQETDAQAYNILCLTFSDAGVVAMRQRLLRFIGPDAHRVQIYTFHSFCNKIIQDNLGLFGRQMLEPLDDLERIDIVRDLLHELPPEHPMRRSTIDGYFYESHLRDLFRLMKQEGWKVNELLKKIDQYLEQLPERGEYRYQRNHGNNRKGDLKEALFSAEVHRMDLLKAAIPLYENYIEFLHRRGRYDFEDMILWVLDAFQNYPALLRSLQEQFLYVLVDEYQDTNGAQNQILRALISYWESPNVFIVGDDDQSIYEFQGARLKNLMDFHEDYASFLQTIVLRDNYRSTPAILRLAGQLIQQNERRLITELTNLGLDKKLEAAGTYATSDLEPVLRVYENQFQEIAGITARIEEAKEAGIPPEEIAVIYSRHRQAELLVEFLQRRGIPFQVQRSPNILDDPFLQRIRTMLTYLVREQTLPGSGEAQLFRILHYRNWGIRPDDLARVNLAKRKESNENLRIWLPDRLPEIPQLTEPGKLRNTLLCLDALLDQLDAMPLLRFVQTLFQETGLLGEAMEEEEREEKLGVLHSFLDFVRQQSLRNPRLDPAGLLDILRRMDANKLAIPRTEVLPGGDGVQLLTAHSSKGLEFRYVFMLGCSRKEWEPQNSRGRYNFHFPDTITLSGESDETEARRRLFYVAMTRAKEVLEVSYHRLNAKGKEEQASTFVDELRSIGQIVEQEGLVDRSYVLAVRNLLLKPSVSTGISVYSHARIDQLLEGYALSVSGLNAYLRCPLSFFYEHILRVPRIPSEAASFGTAMHNSLQWLFERMLVHKSRQFPALDQFEQQFIRQMEGSRAWFKPESFQQRLQLGLQYLRAIYDRGVRQWIKNSRVEMEIRQIEWNGVPIQGVIDKVEYLPDNQVRLVDYKTGRVDPARVRPATARNPLGGPYWRQLVFYKILFESRRVDAKRASEGRIAYLEPDKQGAFEQVDIPLNAAAVDQLSPILSDVWEKIRSHQFSGCEKPGCNWCRFEREQLPPDLRLGTPEEPLDDPL